MTKRIQREEITLTRRVQAEYLECPGLNLTEPQMRRFLGVDEPTCAALVEDLVSTRFLARTEQGRYVIAHAAP
jgi:hypothetical protein